MKLVSQLDSSGYFVSSAIADPSPLEPGVFLLPGGCVNVPPIDIPEGKRARYNGKALVLEDIPAPPPPDPVPPPTPEQVEVEITFAIQRRLDDFARTRGYDDMKSLVAYAGDSDPQFDKEGTYGKKARSDTWVASRSIQAQVQAGMRKLPTGIADIEADLPALVWPA